ncbi:MAG TPA: trypsin-like peptidase domain-containing protein [Gaiellaceae bacterium]|nr:trypsin-like peptidase domain-containing protein [Gaiellaceae bacterium]
MPSNRNRIATAVAVAALAGAGAGAGIVALAHDSGHPTSNAATASNVSSIANGTTLSVGELAKASIPSVVEIDSTSTSANGSPFPGSGSSKQAAEGTGFVYDTKGDIVTNDHVVSGADSLTVKFSDGSTAKATIVGEDPSTDIAVIHVSVDASKLHPLTLGDSSTAQIGDGVVAIGNPFGLDDTVTSGIISALNREITSPDNSPIEGAIQTDAAINHGNSGGPLFNMKGEVIGITSQIQSDSGGNDGVGFAVPSNTVKSIATQLISTGKAQHALLGVNVQDGTNGVAVKQVESGSGAADAGLKAGDTITAVGSTKVTTAEQLRAIIASHQPGDTITLSVRQSDGSTKTVKATLGSKS